MSAKQILAGFHAVGARLRQAPETIDKLYLDSTRRDKRVQALHDRARAAGVSVQEVDVTRLEQLAGGLRHQGVVATARAGTLATHVDDVLDKLEDTSQTALLLLLDGVTDPHNLGACLRTADAAGAHAVIAPRDKSASLTAAARRVASGAAETVPYIRVTNLARTMRHLKQRGVWLVGTDDRAEKSLYESDLNVSMGWVMGAEGTGLRHLSRQTCDELVTIPMHGSVESLNVSVATGICLYETLRQRG